MWKFRNMPLSNPCVQEEITIKIRKYFGLKKKKRTTFAFNSTESLKNLSAIRQNFILISSFGDLDSATDGNLNTKHDWGQAYDYKFLAEISFPLSQNQIVIDKLPFISFSWVQCYSLPFCTEVPHLRILVSQGRGKSSGQVIHKTLGWSSSTCTVLTCCLHLWILVYSSYLSDLFFSNFLEMLIFLLTYYAFNIVFCMYSI